MQHEQNTGMNSTAIGNGSGGASRHLVSCDSLCGNAVKNNEGESLGDIKDMMIDVTDGSISYVVLSFGGLLGMGTKYFAVPWQAFKLDQEDKCFRLNVSKEKLKDAPGFDHDNWPNMADQSWSQGIHSYYSTRPYETRRML
jgi:sporulation protein YlmC with PRC-barrel domain